MFLSGLKLPLRPAFLCPKHPLVGKIPGKSNSRSATRRTGEHKSPTETVNLTSSQLSSASGPSIVSNTVSVRGNLGPNDGGQCLRLHVSRSHHSNEVGDQSGDRRLSEWSFPWQYREAKSNRNFRWSGLEVEGRRSTTPEL